MNKKITQEILEDLAQVRENLLALSDDIWLSIDHNDNERLEEGVAFKKEYNTQVNNLDILAENISTLVRQFMGLSDSVTSQDNTLSNQGLIEIHGTHEIDRKIEELDTREPHSLDEDFTYKRPFGIVIKETAYLQVLTWREVYLKTCRYFYSVNSQRFRSFLNHSDFVSKRGNETFSDDEKTLRYPLPISHNLFAEGNLSANNIRDNIKKIVRAYEMHLWDVKVYLREDRDAG